MSQLIVKIYNGSNLNPTISQRDDIEQRYLYFAEVSNFKKLDTVYKRGRNLNGKHHKKLTSLSHINNKSTESQSKSLTGSTCSQKIISRSQFPENKLKLEKLRSNIKIIIDDQKMIQHNLEDKINEIKDYLSEQDLHDIQLENQLKNIKTDLIQNKRDITQLIQIIKQRNMIANLYPKYTQQKQRIVQTVKKNEKILQTCVQKNQRKPFFTKKRYPKKSIIFDNA